MRNDREAALYIDRDETRGENEPVLSPFSRRRQHLFDRDRYLLRSSERGRGKKERVSGRREREQPLRRDRSRDSAALSLARIASAEEEKAHAPSRLFHVPLRRGSGTAGFLEPPLGEGSKVSDGLNRREKERGENGVEGGHQVFKF